MYPLLFKLLFCYAIVSMTLLLINGILHMFMVFSKPHCIVYLKSHNHLPMVYHSYGLREKLPKSCRAKACYIQFNY